MSSLVLGKMGKRDSVPREGVTAVEYKETVEGTPAEAERLFRKTVWDELGFQTMPLLNMMPYAGVVKEGDKHGNGAIRAVPGAWLPMLHEEVLSVTPGSEIVYRVKSGPFPASYHQGRVLFEDAGHGMTMVTWAVQFKAYPCCDGLCRGLIWFMFPNGLNALKEACKEAKRGAGKAVAAAR